VRRFVPEMIDLIGNAQTHSGKVVDLQLPAEHDAAA
jgi:hypothetical protein